METIPNNRYLFQTKRNAPYSPRRIQRVVKKFAEEASIKANPTHLPAPGHYLAFTSRDDRR